MNCAKRDLLKAELKVATHELMWAHDEMNRVANEQPDRIPEFDRIVQSAEHYRAQAAQRYEDHLLSHQCGIVEQTS